ncbi:MAG: AmmeMemoRadiSam system protein B, partial [Chloroflexota bacterium]
MESVRQPVVAGQFYPGSAAALEAQVAGFIDPVAPKEEVVGLVSPHAGYMFSGPVAGATISRVTFKDTFVIIGPNHSGVGQRYSVMAQGRWRTPMGDVEIDSELARRILGGTSHLREDEMAHLHEHSIEVQVPFLQYFKRDVRIVPIVLGPGDGAAYKDIGHAVAGAVREMDRQVVVMASSDMT